MSVSVNIFAILEDENDEVKPTTTTTTSGSQVQKQKAAPTTQPQKKVETAKVATEGKVKAPAKTENKPPKESPSEGSATAPFKSNKPPRQQQQHDKRDHAQKEESKEEPRQPAHRQFDRKSGTGRGKEVKRSGGGKSNWGTQDDDRKASEEPIDSETKEETPVKTEAIVAESTVTTTDAKPEQKEEGKDEEEEDNTKTLEEFLGSVKKPSFQLPPPRQIDESLGAKGTAHRKEREEEPMKKEKKEEKKEEKKDDKKFISADQVLKFNDSPKPFGRGRGNKRGDSSPRGGRGFGGKRGGSGVQRSAAPNFKDESSFPSLSTTTTKA